MKLELVLTE